MFGKKSLASAVLLGFLYSAPQGRAAISVTSMPSVSAAALVNQILGPGVTASNIVYVGAPCAGAVFSGGTGIIGFDSGIILSTGCAASVRGPNVQDTVTTQNGWPGDPLIDALSGTTSFDAASLDFDFVPTTSVLTFQYVFASDEYMEYVGIDDAFGLFVDGVNIALLPGTSTVVSINTVNWGSNATYYRENEISAGAPINTEMDGLTTVLTASVTLTANTSHHLKIVIGDASDQNVDSNVFIQAGSLTAYTPTPSATPGPVITFRKTVDKPWAPASDLVSFTLSLTNSGGGGAVSIQFWDSLPAGLTLKDPGAMSLSSPGLLNWNAGSLGPGAMLSATLVFQMPPTVVAGDFYVNSAWADWVNPLTGAPDSQGAMAAIAALVTENFTLSRNAFRPALDQTLRASYTGMTPGHVRVMVYNSAGEKVADLLDLPAASPGLHEVFWNGRNGAGDPLASGVYILRAEGPSFSATRRVAILR